MARKKTHEEFVAEIHGLWGDEYDVLGTYINAHTKIRVRHNACGYEHDKRPNDLKQGYSCPRCAKNIKLTQEEFTKEVLEVCEGDYSVLGTYVNARTSIKMRHNVCGLEFDVTPDHFKRGSRCPQCATKIRADKRRIPHERFVQEVLEIGKGEYSVLGIYSNSQTKVKMQHSTCGHSFYMLPSNFKRGQRCPRCAESKGERAIRLWLSDNNIEYTTQYPIKYDHKKRSLRLDFFVQGVAIEYDGELHYKAVEQFDGKSGLQATQRRDIIKDEYCADNGIPLIRIPYWDFDNIDEILTQKLLPLLAEKKAM